MPDKAKYSGDVWFVRGVPAELRAEVATAAERAGMKVGAWVERALRAALEQPGDVGRGPGDAAGGLAARVADLAATVEVVRTLFEKHRRQDFPSVVKRLERLEASQVPPAIPGRQRSALDAVEPVGGVEVPETTETHEAASGEAEEMDVIGGDDGTQRRFTPTGAVKVEVLLRAGLSDVEIARMFAVDQDAIRQRRKKLEAKYGPGLGVLPLELTRQVGEMLKAERPPAEVLAILANRPLPEGSGGDAEVPAPTETLPGASDEASKGKQTRRKWTDADDDALRRIAERGGTQTDACREMDRPSSMISVKWRELELPVSPRKGRKLKR